MADNTDIWISIAGWHTDYLSDNCSHQINLKRFYDDLEGLDYYKNIDSCYAKKYISKESEEKQYSEGWSKFIPNPISKNYYSQYHVTYLKEYLEDEDIYVVIIRYFDDEENAIEYYNKLDKEVKQIVVKGAVKEFTGYEAFMLL